jgi:hypothetical protein
MARRSVRPKCRRRTELSAENQFFALAAYAGQRSISVAQSYVDEARSGVSHKPVHDRYLDYVSKPLELAQDRVRCAHGQSSMLQVSF